MSADVNDEIDDGIAASTTWGYRFRCPQCGFESVTQDDDLRDELISWHEDKDHDGKPVCEWEHDDAIPLSEFPEDEDPDTQAVTVTQRSLEVVGDE